MTIKKIFVCEFITGGGLCDADLPQSLAKEGALMREALLRDLSDACDFSGQPYEIITTIDSRLESRAEHDAGQPQGLSPQNIPAEAGYSYMTTNIHAACRAVSSKDNVWHVWNELIKSCDAVWVIAPETDGVLLKFAELTNKHGKIWLGCSPEAIELCGNKLKTAQFLHAHGVQVPVFTLDEFLAYDAKYPNVLFSHHNQYVCKPIFGAGCEATYIFSNKKDLVDFMQNGHEESHLIQLFVQGEHASFNMLCAKEKAWLLSCNAQKMSINNSKITYQGSSVNAHAQHWQVFERIAKFLAEKLTGLNGLVGVDVVFDEKKMVIIEINPRLTTSYVGLRQSIGQNPAQLTLNVLQNTDFELPKLKKKVVDIHV